MLRSKHDIKGEVEASMTLQGLPLGDKSTLVFQKCCRPHGQREVSFEDPLNCLFHLLTSLHHLFPKCSRQMTSGRSLGESLELFTSGTEQGLKVLTIVFKGALDHLASRGLLGGCSHPSPAQEMVYSTFHCTTLYEVYSTPLLPDGHSLR